MKSLSVINVVDINNIFKEKEIDYTLHLKDACGNQSMSLECTGKEINIGELCDIINNYLKSYFIEVIPGTINPYNILIK